MTRARREDGDPQYLVERLPSALAVVAPDGTIVYWNPAAQALFGYPADEALTRNYDALLVPPARRTEQQDALRHAQEAGSSCFTTERLTKGGTALDVQVMLDQGTGEDAGHVFITQRATRNVHCRCGALAAPDGKRPAKELTTRQLQVLRLIAEGRSTRDIARGLGLSAKTIETHRGHLMQRLRLRSVAGLVRYAVAAGLVPSNPWSGRAGKDP